jgi:hypothetical protein
VRVRVAFRDAVPAVDFAEFAEMQGWELEGSVPPTQGQAEEYVWLVDDDSYVHWINDPVLHRAYGMILGPDPSAMVLSVRSEFDSYTINEAVEEFAQASEWPERVEALSVVAAAAPQDFDQEIFGVIAAGLTDPHPVVRHKAALAVFYARWRQFLPFLQTMAAEDAYDEARRVAAIAIETIENPELDPYPS